MDATTTQLVKEWIAKYDAAVQREDLEEMTRIICVCAESPNRPFRREVMRQLELA
jgi:hypothetical protein